MRPYLIVSHDYNRGSAGVRALHGLCSSLNVYGLQAWVTSPVVNPDWNTPTADEETRRLVCEEGVVVYPEVEAGNPLGARRVARYILNRPGFIRGDVTFDAGEALFCYCGLLREFVPSDDRVLTVPVVDAGVFYDRGLERYKEAFWVGKARTASGDMPRVLNEDGMTQITPDWPESWEVLAALFQTARVFYSYTDYTMLTVEARLCGCPTVVMPSGFYTRDGFAAGSPGGIAGLAWGPSLGEIERARATVGVFRRTYQVSVAGFEAQLDRFVEVTQGMEGYLVKGYLVIGDWGCNRIMNGTQL